MTWWLAIGNLSEVFSEDCTCLESDSLTWVTKSFSCEYYSNPSILQTGPQNILLEVAAKHFEGEQSSDLW